jgi:RimJ/RimL family protein N-acetyltransferase
MIECFRITDYTLVAYPLRACWEDIAEDGQEFKMPDVINNFYIGILEDGNYVGYVKVQPMTTVMSELHIVINKGFRNIKKYAQESIRYGLEQIPECMKVVVNVAETKRGVIHLVESLGFRHQGYSSDSYMMNGKLVGQVQLGITRNEMERLWAMSQVVQDKVLVQQ